MPLPTPHRIVIIGAGFGGLRTALELLKRRVRLGAATITLIDSNAAHVYTPLLYEVAMTCLESEEEQAACNIRDSASLMFADNPYLHRKDERLKFVQANVTAIDWEAHEVKLEGKDTIGFDDIVLATGGEAATYGIPGVSEFAIKMKTLEDSLVIRRRVAEALEEVKKKTRECFRVVVVGAGANGCEGAGEIAFSMRRLARAGHLPGNCYSVTLLDSGKDILAMFRPKARAMARKRLESLGVVVKSNMKVMEFKADGVVTGDGMVDADIVVWAGGMKPRDLVKTWGFPVDEKGFVKVDPTLAVSGLPHAWALGDCAAIVHPVSGARVPALAQAASKEATTLAENITRTLERKATVNFVPPTTWNTVVPLGGAWAVADLQAFVVSGWLGYCLRKAADLMYFFSVLPWRKTWSMWKLGLSGFKRVK